MTLAELKVFIKNARIEQGVSWNLVDTTPLKGKGILFTLYAFNERGLVAEVSHIEERERHQIPQPFLLAIADARVAAGMDPSFQRGHAEEEAHELFTKTRDSWVNDGYMKFIRGEVP